MKKIPILFSLVFCSLFLPLLALQQDNPPPQKVLFTSIPKAGTHLLKKAIMLIQPHPVKWLSFRSVADFSPARDLQMRHLITGTHLFPEIDIVRTSYPNTYLKILIIRDPRDVMLSFMYHLRNKMQWNACPGFDYTRFRVLSLDQQLRETMLFPAACRNPNTCFLYAAEWIRDPSVFVCRFEDLIGPKGGGTSESQLATLKNLSEHLGYSLSDERINSIANQLFGGTWTFREGKIGAWKEYYSEENKQLFKELMGQAVIDLGYEEDNNW